MLQLIVPFVFVFALINAQKNLQEGELSFLWYGILASLSLLYICFNVPFYLSY